MGGYCLRLLGATLPVLAAGYAAHGFFERYFSYFPAFALTMLTLAAAELLFFGMFRLISFRTVFLRFFAKKRKKIPLRS